MRLAALLTLLAGAFDGVLEGFRRRFAATKSEQGAVMATTLAYAMQERRTSRQAEILADFRESEDILQLFQKAKQEQDRPHKLSHPG